MNRETLTAVPLLDLKAQYASIKEEVKTAIDSVLESQHFILGPEVANLEASIASYVGSRFAIGCASGSDAILLALSALDIGRYDEVICPSYTFFATAGYVTRVGARPVFADIDPATYNLDPESVRAVARHCRRLKAIMPVHLFGQAADMDAFTQIGAEFGVPIVEDAAQAIGCRDRTGARVGTRSAISCFSFFPSKNLGAFGDAGMVTTNDAELAERMSVLRVHGGKPKYYHKWIGVNSRLDSLQAGILKVKLKYLDRWSDQRRMNAERYDELFQAAGAALSRESFASPSAIPLRVPSRGGWSESHIYNQYVIRVPARLRDGLRAHLTQQRIGTEIYYPVPLHLQECFSYLGHRQGEFPESEGAARETLALPIYPELTVPQIEYVVETVVGYLKNRKATIG